MTTIVATDDIIYADTRRCTNLVPSDNTNKIHVTDDLAFVGAGRLNQVIMFWDQLSKNPQQMPELCLEGIDVCWYVRDQKRWYTAGENGPELCALRPIIMGSGGIYVQYGLNTGLTIQESFELALKYDSYTGGKLVKFNLATWEFE